MATKEDETCLERLIETTESASRKRSVDEALDDTQPSAPDAASTTQPADLKTVAEGDIGGKTSHAEERPVSRKKARLTSSSTKQSSTKRQSSKHKVDRKLLKIYAMVIALKRDVADFVKYTDLTTSKDAFGDDGRPDSVLIADKAVGENKESLEYMASMAKDSYDLLDQFCKDYCAKIDGLKNHDGSKVEKQAETHQQPDGAIA